MIIMIIIILQATSELQIAFKDLGIVYPLTEVLAASQNPQVVSHVVACW